MSRRLLLAAVSGIVCASVLCGWTYSAKAQIFTTKNDSTPINIFPPQFAGLQVPVGYAPKTPEGWYLGFGVGFDHLQNFTEILPGGTRLSIPTTDTALVVGSFGYRWTSNVRIETEVGFANHQVAAPFAGSADVKSGLVNFVYDFPLSDQWTLSLGAGVGVESFSYCTGAVGGPCTGATGTNLAGQVLAEVSHPVLPNLDIFLQVRDRILLTNSAGVENINEQAALVGARWYFAAPLPPVRNIRTTNVRSQN